MRRAKGLKMFFVMFLLTIGVVTAGNTQTNSSSGVLLTGTVTSAKGEKMEGTTVSAMGEGQTITTSVYTDERGDYYFPRLAEGNYHVWAQAKGYEAGRASLELSGSIKHQDFVLGTLKSVNDIGMQMTGSEWLSSLPAETVQDKKMKEVFSDSCTGCHTPGYVLQNRFDAKGWAAMIDMMSRTDGFGTYKGDDKAPYPAFARYKTELAAYLAKVRGPDSTLQPQLHPRPKGEATLAVVREYSVPIGDAGDFPESVEDGSDWSLGNPSGLHGGRNIHDSELDFYGNIWFTASQVNRGRTYGKVDIKTGKVTNFKVPGRNGLAAASHGIARDPQGNIWFNVSGEANAEGQGESGSLAKVDPKTDKIEIYTPPKGMGFVGGFIDIDTNGNVWAAGTASSALRFDASTHQFTVFKWLTPYKRGDELVGGPYGVTVDREGNGWWSQMNNDIEGKGDIETGKVTEVRLPAPERAAEVSKWFTAEDHKFYEDTGSIGLTEGVPWQQGPRRPGADMHGDTVWVPNWFGKNLAKIDIHTLKVTMYPFPSTEGGIYHIKVDKDHMVWADFQNSDTVGKFDPKTSRWVEYSLPTLGFETHQIGILDRDGRTQVTEASFRTSKVLLMQFRTRQELEALRKEVQDSKRSASSR